MDLAKLQIPDTAKVHVEFPGQGKLYADPEKKKPVVIEVYGPASDQVVAYRRKMIRESQARIGKRGLKGFSKMAPEEMEDLEVDRLVAFTASVQNMVYKGEEVTPETIEKVYRDPHMGWLVDQVRDKVGGWEDFLD